MSDQSEPHFLTASLHLTPEFTLVTACSWLPVAEHAVRQKLLVESLSQGQLDWDEVASLVLRHGVVGQFCTIMGLRSWANVPTEIRDHFKKIRSGQVVRALRQLAELSRIAGIFSNAGISLIPLKGVALSQELYGDPCIRSSCDIDLLVKPEDIEKAEELLLQAGYRHELGFHNIPEKQKKHIISTLHHHEYLNEARGVHVELHWRSCLWTSEQVDALWDTSQSAIWCDIGLQKLSTAEYILFLADHGARHDWPCLKWLSDVAMLVEQTSDGEWLQLYERAAFFDLQRVLGQTAFLLEAVYGIDISEKMKALFYKDPIVQKLALHGVSQLLATSDDLERQARRFAGPRQAYRIKRLKPLTPVSVLLRSIMITHTDFATAPLPDYLFWLYPLLRPILWLKRHCMRKILPKCS